MVKHMLFLCLTIAMLSAPAHTMPNTRQRHINVTPGESCQQLASRYPGITSNDQQHGINFCKINATSGKEFPLTIRHGKHSITLPLADSLSGIEHTKRNVGIDSLNITFSFSTAPTIMHDDARRALFAMFRQMHANDWQMFISLTSPRLRGRDTLINRLPEKSKPWGLDPAYEPTLAEWMNIDELTQWKFYADQLYVDISFYRNSEKMDTSQPGEYLFTMDISTGETHHRGYFESEQHEQWRKHWVDMALMLRKERERAEADARRIGLHIDTHYQDPPLPPPPPGMSNPTLPPKLNACLQRCRLPADRP